MAAALGRAPDAPAVLRAAGRLSSEIEPAARLGLSLRAEDPSVCELYVLGGALLARGRAPLAGRSAEAAMTHGESTHRPRLAEIRDRPDARALEAEGFGALLHLPLLAGGTCLGTLDVAWPTEGEVDEETAAILEHAALILASSLVGHRSAERAAMAHEEARAILDNVEVGLALLGPEGELRSAPSRALVDWLGPPPASGRLWDWLEPHDPAFAEHLDVAWSALTDGFMPTSAALAQLPVRCAAAGRPLELRFRPVEHDGGLREVVLVATDISERLERDAARRGEQELAAAMRFVARDRVGFGAFLQETSRLVDRIREGVASALEVHTLKGNAADAGAASVAEAAHALETALGSGADAEPRREALVEQWRRYRERLEAAMGPELVEVGLTAQEHARFEARVALEAPSLLREVRSWRWERLETRLAHLRDVALRVAERLGKPAPEVELDADRVRLDPAVFGPLWGSLEHAVRNAVDHGLEAPEARRAAGKPERGRVRISARCVEERLQLTLDDDGGGIDWSKVAEAARRRGLPDDTTTDLRAALFAPGLSTAAQVTEVSGRGLGLEALAYEARRLDGAVRVESTPGAGTRLLVDVALPAEDRGPEAPAPEAPPPEQDGWAALVREDLDAHRALLGYEEIPDLGLTEQLEHRIVQLEQAMVRYRTLERSLVEVARHYGAVAERVDRILEKGVQDAREDARRLRELHFRAREAAPEAAELALELLARLQRQDVQGQELADISEAVRAMTEYLEDDAGTLYDRLVQLPSTLDSLLPRVDIDARDVPLDEGGPSLELF
jgi:two-component system chemotaxis sensor kinase CheA